MSIRRTVAAALAMLTAQLPAQVPDLYDPNNIRDVYLTFAQTNWWAQLTANYGPEINIAADMNVDGVTYANVGVRFRGNTSYTQLPTQPQQGWEKKSFNIDLDWLVQGQDIYGFDHLNFNNGFHDPTFLREVLSYHVMSRHGVAPRANWIRLHLNGTYWGVYINVQQPNKDMMKEWFRSNDGNRYRCFPVSGGFSNGRCCYTLLSPLTTTNYLTAYQAKQGDGVDLINMCTVLNAMTPSTPLTTLTAVFNVDSFYRYAAVMNVLTNTDSYLQSGKDHFLYMDEVHGDATTFPFDLNEAMAAPSTLGGVNLAPDYATTNTFRPGFTKTLQIPEWLARYKAHLRAVLDQSMNTAYLGTLASQYHAMLAPHVAADTKKIYSTTLFTNNLNSTVNLGGVGGSSLIGLLPFIQQRYSALNTHAYVNEPRATLSNLTHSPASPTPVQPIQFTVQASSLATAVNLYWRRLGPFLKEPMFDDGLHGDGAANDGIWGVAIASQQAGSLIDYYTEAKTATGAARYLPFAAELERACPKVQVEWPVVPSPIVINEFVAQNNTGAVDENNQHEDWIELFNTSNQTVDISGKWLSDSLVTPKYQFPVGTTIAPFGVLRIWADEDGTQGPLHANFKLSAAGELVALYDNAGQALHDLHVFGPQTADVSTGRLLDGGGPWVTFPVPSYLLRNERTTCGQRTFGAQAPGIHGITLAATGTLQVGTTIQYGATTGPALGIGVLGLAVGGDHIDLAPLGFGNEVLLLSPTSLVLSGSVGFDGAGAAAFSFGIPPIATLAGLRLFGQTFGIGGSGWDSSRAIEVTICP
jgi:spore coat protein CotH